jgi:predicted kinase
MANRVNFIMLVGLPGSGKSSIAKQYLQLNPGVIHNSSDEIRGKLFGDESIQGDPSKVFELMHKLTLSALDNGNDVIYDATNITRKDRMSILNKLPPDVNKVCWVVWAPIEECIRRDYNRSRTVGEQVINRMVRRFQVPYFDEGFDSILVKLNSDMGIHFGLSYLDYIADLNDIPHDNPHHTLKIKEHMFSAGEALVGEKFNVRLAGRFHDIGKYFVKSFKDSKGNDCDTAHYYDHQNVGGYLALPYDSNGTLVAWLINNHMEPFFNSKYYKNLPTYLKEMIDKIHKADTEAH